MKSVPIQAGVSLAAACLVVAIAVGCGDKAPSSPSSTTSSTSSTGAVVAGTVTGEQTGLSVRLVGTDRTAVVGSTGAFEISGVPAGTARLQFSSGAVNATTDVANITVDQYVALLVQVSGSSAQILSDARSRKVSLCHRDDTGGYQLINVGEPAESAHRGHGDARPGEPVPGRPGQNFDSNCRVVGPSVRIKKFTNNEDADTAPGPEIGLGRAVQWRYVVTNDGSVNLTNVTVVDDKGVTVNCVGQNSLAQGASMTCSANGVVTELGPYRNVGTVTAQFSGPGGSGSVTDSDPSHYLGVSPVQIRKFTNGEDADLSPGPSILVGNPITWVYRVTNIGAVTLSGITVVDDRGETVLCPSQTTLAPDATLTCSATGDAVLGLYRNVGTVTATWTLGPITRTVTDSNASHYRGVAPDDEEPKVTLCHRTGNGSYHSITVSINAEPAHRQHGDAKIGEPVPNQPGKTFGPDCRVQ